MECGLDGFADGEVMADPAEDDGFNAQNATVLGYNLGARLSSRLVRTVREWATRSGGCIGV